MLVRLFGMELSIVMDKEDEPAVVVETPTEVPVTQFGFISGLSTDVDNG